MKANDLARMVKNSVSMIDLCNMYSIPLNRAGFTNCPFHTEKTGSLKAYPNGGGWHCFGCGEGGTVIDFTMRYFGLSCMDAIKKLNDDFNLNLPIGHKLSLKQWKEAKEKVRQLRIEQEQRQKLHQDLRKRYQDALDQFVAYDVVLSMKAPEKATDAISDEYADALHDIARARYELDSAEAELYEFEKRMKGR